MRQAFSHFLFCAVETRHLRRQSFAAPVILCHGAFANRSHLLCLLYSRRSSLAGQCQRFCPSSREAAPRRGKGDRPRRQRASYCRVTYDLGAGRPSLAVSPPKRNACLHAGGKSQAACADRHARCARVHACGEPCRRRRRLPRSCVPAFDPLLPEIVYRSVGCCGSIRLRHETFIHA